MKAIFLSWLIIISFLFSNKLGAQHAKLNTAFYYSSGIVVDNKGNVFVTGKNNKVIKITQQGKAELFAGGGERKGYKK